MDAVSKKIIEEQEQQFQKCVDDLIVLLRDHCGYPYDENGSSWSQIEEITKEFYQEIQNRKFQEEHPGWSISFRESEDVLQYELEGKFAYIYMLRSISYKPFYIILLPNDKISFSTDLQDAMMQAELEIDIELGYTSITP